MSRGRDWREFEAQPGLGAGRRGSGASIDHFAGKVLGARGFADLNSYRPELGAVVEAARGACAVSAALSTVAAATERHRPGHALLREFHTDPEIHAEEIERIWRRSWLFAGLSIEARAPGHFFSFELGADSILIVRGEGGALHAVHNTCRHRGMRVCDIDSGHAKRWVCPYHQWSYALDGSLLGCGGMEGELEDPDAYRLLPGCGDRGRRADLRLARPRRAGSRLARPQDELRAAALEPQGLDRARIAHRIDYQVAANWKLIWENNRECWHCHVGHPQYIRANFDAVRRHRARPRELARNRAPPTMRARSTRSLSCATAIGEQPDEHAEPGLYALPGPRTGGGRRTARRWCPGSSPSRSTVTRWRR